MSGWIDRITGSNPHSAGHAKERLKLVLIHDRTDLGPEALTKMKNELIQVIARYVEINPEEVKISMNQDGREQRLVADIPIITSHKRKIG